MLDKTVGIYMYTNDEGGKHIRFASVCVHVVYRVYCMHDTYSL